MDPLSLHKNLQILVRNNVNYVILEASSHGLEQKRLDNLNINIFTNLLLNKDSINLLKNLLKSKNNIKIIASFHLYNSRFLNNLM